VPLLVQVSVPLLVPLLARAWRPLRVS